MKDLNEISKVALALDEALPSIKNLFRALVDDDLELTDDQKKIEELRCKLETARIALREIHCRCTCQVFIKASEALDKLWEASE